MTLDTYTQVFRENYVTLAFARGNTNVQLLPGDSNEVKLGVRSFLIPGVDLMTTYEIRNETTRDPTTKAEAKASRKGITSQLHLFF